MRIAVFLVVVLAVFVVVGVAMVLKSRSIALGYEVRQLRETLHDIRNENNLLAVEVGTELRLPRLAASARRNDVELDLNLVTRVAPADGVVVRAVDRSSVR